jgi:hypothetical protein
MESLLTTARQQGIPCQALIGDGAIWDTLLNMIHENRIDLVIVGTHGRRGLQKLLLGSVAEEVFPMAPCPVLTVGPRTSEMHTTRVRLGHTLYLWSSPLTLGRPPITRFPWRRNTRPDSL